MERRNKKTKQKGNGEGTIYFSEALNCYVAQYVEPSGKRKTLKQRKNEKVGDFKNRFRNIISSINQGSYISVSNETILTIANNYIEQKNLDGITSDRSFKRNQDTINQIEKTCSKFCNKPIQKVTVSEIEDSKKNIRKYLNNCKNILIQLN